MQLTREQILSKDDLPRKQVKVPEWGGNIWVRTLTGSERDKFEIDIGAYKKKQNVENIRARFAVLTVCNKKGDRLFKDSDAAALGEKSSKALDKIYSVAAPLNGLSDTDVEDLVKN